MIFVLVPVLFFADIGTVNVDDGGQDVSEVPCLFTANYGWFCICHTEHEYILEHSREK